MLSLTLQRFRFINLQVRTKISCLLFVLNIYYPFSLRAIKILLQPEHDSPALDGLVNTSLLLCKVQTSNYRRRPQGDSRFVMWHGLFL
jgi:hypothetical protein